MRAALLLPLLVPLLLGCGRLSFDPSGPDGGPAHPDGDRDSSADARDDDAGLDSGTAHDEDGDGIADAVDPCPHLAGTADDADSDGVGDACDPNPTTATERWVVFTR